MVTFEEFKKLDLRIAVIKEVVEHPDADKLYILNVDNGEKIIQMVAGIRPYYKKEELINKQIVIVNNLVPVTLRGVESQAMLLAASQDNKVILLAPDKPVYAGSIIR